ncbi:MAG: hypothetical protein CM15mP51_20480 [Porticoccaceae bacterium]|nr:MAG: hypothetical protein CM15mP51_20480 [Porticoccaceae bacterium]
MMAYSKFQASNTGGLVNVGTVSEQMLYEIGAQKNICYLT